MVKTITIRQIAETAELLRSDGLKDVLEAEYRKGKRTGKLTRIRFSTGPSGRPTKRLIDCIDNGEPCCYDKTYEGEILAFIVNGRRVEISPK
jgi:hypothetical protein